MDHEQLRIVENLAGRLARHGLLRLRRMTRAWRRQPGTAADFPRDAGEIVLVKLWGAGAMVLASRAIMSLRRGFPKARLTLVTTPELAPLYEGSGLFDRTLTLNVQDIPHLPRHLARLRRDLAAEAPDAALNLDGLSELSALVTHKCAAPLTVGFERPGERRWGYSIPIPYDPKANVSLMLYAAARDLGGGLVEEAFVPPPVREQDRSYVAEMLAGMHADPHALMVGININAGPLAPLRRWPGEKFALLAQAIEDQEEYRTVFFGTHEEERYVQRHVKFMSAPVVNLAGALSLRQYLAFLERLHLVVANDSGTIQLASALGVPTVGIFGPEHPDRVRLVTSERHAEVFHLQPCCPCASLFEMNAPPCPLGERCLREISLDEVRAVAMDMLDHLSDPVDPPWLTRRKARRTS